MGVYNPAGFGGSSLPAIRIGNVQDVPYNAAGGANSVSVAFPDGTELVEVAAHIVGTGVRIKIGTNPDVTTGDPGKLLPGSGSWFFVAHPGEQLAAISDDGNSGVINITIAQSLG